VSSNKSRLAAETETDFGLPIRARLAAAPAKKPVQTGINKK
jgi:transposase-like protein